MVFVYASLLLIINMIAWLSTIFLAPGNWLMVAFAAIYAYFLPVQYTPRVSWPVVGIVFGLAVVGEIIEFAAGAAGAKSQGGSRTGAVYAIAGAFVGSIAGAMLGIPIPVIGSVIAAVGGGAVGAFAGAYWGESGRLHHERFAIGKGAMVGRLAGTAGKMAVGIIIVVVLTIDSFFDLAIN